MTTPSSFPAPPAEDDEDAYVFVDHREEETAIVEYVSERLAPEDALEGEDDGERFVLRHRGREHLIPLAFSRHDRYIMIASLAELLRPHYQFFVLNSSLGSDTHGLLIVPRSDVQRWGALPDHLIALDPGYDYFHDIRVPYLNHESSAPNFDEDRQGVASANEAMGGLVQALFEGKMDSAATAKLSKLAVRDPELAGQSEAEVSAELQRAFNEALASPEMDELRQVKKRLADLKSLANAPPKPWWKFW